jgi:hypothetical protein
MAFTIKQNDTAPPLVATLTQGDPAVPIVLTGATVKFIMRQGISSPITGSCVLTDAILGIVTYNWISTDTAVNGTYDVEFEITHASGKIQTVPNDGYQQVVIIDDLG